MSAFCAIYQFPGRRELKTSADQLAYPSVVLTADTCLSVAVELGMEAAAAATRLVLKAGRSPPGGCSVRRRSAPVLAEITASQSGTREAAPVPAATGDWPPADGPDWAPAATAPRAPAIFPMGLDKGYRRVLKVSQRSSADVGPFPADAAEGS